MKVEEFENLTKEDQQKELEKCQTSFSYFYNHYCRKEGMPEYTEEQYLKEVEAFKISFNNRRNRRRL